MELQIAFCSTTMYCKVTLTYIYIYQTLLSKGTYSNAYINTVMAVAAMQGADKHIRTF